MRKLLARMNSAITVHGFRSTFRDWSAEKTDYANQVCEMALAHAIKNKDERAYRRGPLFDKRVDLMSDWATFCYAPPAKVLRPRFAKAG
jgi:integrase